ncbi:hypothetical protein Patl1_20629 [Pistacia atlantica]|uniref:Uncharacterized protein n=1 Tax=Pistacia atlantica TaxID=434234 RepID=A0ACC1BLD7_9ROSI|nr:hypothetical protein Patl1_20629 [Pistacia atlantica]
MALNKVKEIVTSFPVVMFSKTYCGYCRRAKELLTQLGPSLMRKVSPLSFISNSL